MISDISLLEIFLQRFALFFVYMEDFYDCDIIFPMTKENKICWD